MSFIKCNQLWAAWLAQWNSTTTAQKEAFCSLVNGCVEENEIGGGAGAPASPPAAGQKIYVNTTTGQLFYATSAGTWAVVPDNVGTPFAGLTIGSGGNVVFSGNGSAGSPLTANVVLPPVSAPACDQLKAGGPDTLTQVFGLNAAGECKQEAVIVAPTFCQDAQSLPAGAISTVVGFDAGGSCVRGSIPPSAGTNWPDGRSTDSGQLISIGSDGKLLLTAAQICAALQASGCDLSSVVPPLAVEGVSVCNIGSGSYTGTIDQAQAQVISSAPLSGITLQTYINGAWQNIGGPVSTSVPPGSPAGVASIGTVNGIAHTPGAVSMLYYRVIAGSLVSATFNIPTTNVGTC